MKVLIIGATSAMAQSASRKFAESGADFFIAGRDPAKMESVANDLRVRGAGVVHSYLGDLNDLSAHEQLVSQAFTKLERVDQVLLAHGYLGDQTAAELDALETEQILLTNFNGPVSLITRIANRLEAQRSGSLAVISSIAGDRGRRSNYVYGSAKGGLSVFLAGLEIRMSKVGVRVVIIKPGFVDSPMTSAMKKGPIWASSEKAGALIQHAMKKSSGVVYVPGFWRLIMLIIRSIPGPIFRKLPL